jgi:hypothetical protein
MSWLLHSPCGAGVEMTRPHPPAPTHTARRYKEALESELACVKLRGGCCLTPSFITRDLQGRGLVSVVPTTAGQLVRLVVR